MIAIKNKGEQMKNIVFKLIILAIFITIVPNYTFANEEQTLEEQRQEFGIQDFIKNAKQYTGDFFEDVDLDEILDDAIEGKVDNSSLLKRLLNLLGDQVLDNIKGIISILAIIIIHSILKSISESLENDGVSKLIYYVQYILIVTIIMGNFSEIIKLVQETSNNLGKYFEKTNEIFFVLFIQ